MAQQQQVPLNVQASVAAGTPRSEIAQWARTTVYLFGTFTATVQIEISPDGTNWFAYGSPFTAKGVLEITAQASQIRANTTAWTSGAPSAIVIGQYSQQGG